MTTFTDESVSALFDGELNGDEKQQMLDRLCKDDSLRHRWERYHLISDVFGRQLPVSIPADFSKKVMQAIANEPAIISFGIAAPKPNTSANSNGADRYSGSRWLGKVAVLNRDMLMKKASGAAIAASVAAIALISYQVGLLQQPLLQQPELAALSTQTSESPMASTPRGQMLNPPLELLSQGAMQASNKSSTLIPVPTTSVPIATVDSPYAQINPQLHKYILNHNQHFSGTRIQGLIPYARIIATPTPTEQIPSTPFNNASQLNSQTSGQSNLIGQQ